LFKKKETLKRTRKWKFRPRSVMKAVRFSRTPPTNRKIK
jgi:hypothetical protein